MLKGKPAMAASVRIRIRSEAGGTTLLMTTYSHLTFAVQQLKLPPLSSTAGWVSQQLFVAVCPSLKNPGTAAGAPVQPTMVEGVIYSYARDSLLAHIR